MSSQDFPQVPEQGDAANLRGHVMIDEHQQKVGKVTDVIYDDGGHARWAVVDPGVLRAEHFVPVEGSYVADDGTVVVPFGKDMVTSAPKVPRDHVLEPEVERQLEDHYELGTGARGRPDFGDAPTTD
jgi:hypothetical protein